MTRLSQHQQIAKLFSFFPNFFSKCKLLFWTFQTSKSRKDLLDEMAQTIQNKSDEHELQIKEMKEALENMETKLNVRVLYKI